MIDLAEALERFNRKERNLLVRKALGHSPATPLQLSDDFRSEVTKAINERHRSEAFNITIPQSAWWATDYHFSWLAGGLALFLQDKPDLAECYENQETGKRKLVEGNQEDIDLVIATGCDLILIEAKAYGSYTNKQMKSKVERLELLHEFYLKLKSRDLRSVNFHLVLLSPENPKKLNCRWPEWACPGGTPAHIKLPLNTNDVLSVTRCSSTGEPSQEGQHWRLVEG